MKNEQEQGKKQVKKIQNSEKIENKIVIKENKKFNKGITLIALVITTIFSYDKNVKSSNNKGFLLATI